jgi:hypothetical protein
MNLASAIQKFDVAMPIFRGQTMRETLNQSPFCGEPAPLCDVGRWKIKGLA